MLRQQAIESELQHFSQSHPPAIQGVSWQVRNLLNCIHDELFDPDLNVKTLKSRCRMRDNNISCRFKYEMGISINAYIASLRFEAVTLLLQDRSSSVSDVAQSVGYRNLQTFYRAFKHQFHCTPGVFRTSAVNPTSGLS